MKTTWHRPHAVWFPSGHAVQNRCDFGVVCVQFPCVIRHRVASIWFPSGFRVVSVLFGRCRVFDRKPLGAKVLEFSKLPHRPRSSSPTQKRVGSQRRSYCDQIPSRIRVNPCDFRLTQFLFYRSETTHKLNGSAIWLPNYKLLGMSISAKTLVLLWYIQFQPPMRIFSHPLPQMVHIQLILALYSN